MIVEIVVAVVATAFAFASGVILADRFNQRAAYEMKDALQRQYVRLKAGVDADDPAQPYVYTPPFKYRYSVSPEFVDRLRTKGSATESIKPQQVG